MDSEAQEKSEEEYIEQSLQQLAEVIANTFLSLQKANEQQPDKK